MAVFLIYALIGLLAVWGSSERPKDKAKRLPPDARRREELARHNEVDR